MGSYLEKLRYSAPVHRTSGMQVLLLLLVVAASAGRIVNVEEAKPAEITTTPINPPPHDELARVARYLVHQLDWSMMATISAREPTIGYPFQHSISIADGVETGTGIPYMYQSNMAMNTVDLEANPRMSMGITLAMTDYCKRKNYDEEKSAKHYLFTRHPEMILWPADHGFFFSKCE